MGIYERDYYRGEGTSFLGSISERGRACRTLILLNIIIFVLQLATLERPAPNVTTAGLFTQTFWLSPTEVLHGKVWQLFTYAFLHDERMWTHILFNMLFLWWFGSELEDLYGTREFTWLYLFSAVLGGLAFTAWGALTNRPNPCVGASGAVTAVMVIYALHFPQRIIYLWFIIPIPIWVLVVFQVASDTLIFASGMATRTAVVVHLTGAGFGFLYYRYQWRLAGLASWRPWRRKTPHLRLYREEDDLPTPVPAGAPPDGSEIDEHLEAKVDAVLEKVSRVGADALTEGERQILLRASELYRRRKS